MTGTGTWTDTSYKLEKAKRQCRLAGIRANPISNKSPRRHLSLESPSHTPGNTNRCKPTTQPQPVERKRIVSPLSARTQCHLPDQPPPLLDRRTALFYTLHIIFNHVQLRTIQLMARENLLPLPNELKGTPPEISCFSCTAAKARRSHHHSTTHRYAIGVAVSSDVCGPIPKTSTHGNKYIMTFLDCTSRYAYAHFTATRKSVLSFIVTMVAIVRCLHDKTPHVITTDNAKEYVSSAAQHFHAQEGITLRPTLPYTPQENSLAERFNGTLLAAVRSTLHHAKLPDEYWEDAARYTIFKYNITRHNSTGSLPYTTWFGPPPITQLYAFGQLGSIPHVTSETRRKKLDDRGFISRYMYDTYPTHIVVLELATGKYSKIRTANFRPYSRRTDPNTSTINIFKCYTPHRTPSKITSTTLPPKSRKQAQKYPDAIQCADAHNIELEKLDNMKAIKWLPPEQLPEKLIPLKMTYRYKRDTAGNITERKVRRAVRGERMHLFLYLSLAVYVVAIH